MINTNSIAFKVVSYVATVLVTIGGTVMVSNLVRRGGVFNFKTPVDTNITTDVSKEEADKKEAKKEETSEEEAKKEEVSEEKADKKEASEEKKDN